LVTENEQRRSRNIMKISFIGGGNMTQAILGGLIASGHAARDCFVIEPADAARAKLDEQKVLSAAAWDARALDADVILLAVKPQVMRVAIAPLVAALGHQLVISIAAGVRTADLSRWLGDAGPEHQSAYERIVRAMPNTPALVHAGITGLYAMPAVAAEEKRAAEKLLAAVGKTVWFDNEAALDAVTAVSGSGPAYVFYFMEALEEAAIELGFDAKAARVFALETFAGSVKLARESVDSPATLRANVTSKRGTTERAIETFDRAGLRAKFIDGVKAAAARSAELGQELSKEAGQEPGQERAQEKSGQ
jgi:pyrroline-5-carboxylate reductase